MSEAYTVSFQSAKKVNQAHNRREAETIDRQIEQEKRMGILPHIDKNGKHEIWVDMTPTEALHTLLDEAIQKYNEGKKPSRKTSFEKEIAKYTSKPNSALVREVIYEIGNKDSHPDENECRRLLYAQYQAFKQNNPNLYIIGAYLHADEPNSAMHLHIDFIPFHKKKERGIDVQIGMTGALEEMGYTNQEKTFKSASGRQEGAMAQWDAAMHKMKQKVLEDFGYFFTLGKGKKEKGETQKHSDPSILRQEASKMLDIYKSLGGDSEKTLLSLFALNHKDEFDAFKEKRKAEVIKIATEQAKEILPVKSKENRSK